METILEDMKLCLTDLLQAGLATAGSDFADRAASLAEQAQLHGLATGAELFRSISGGIRRRSNQMEKSDAALTLDIFRAARYIELCRERLTEENIRRRWQEGEQPCE